MDDSFFSKYAHPPLQGALAVATASRCAGGRCTGRFSRYAPSPLPLWRERECSLAPFTGRGLG